jgi:hypothetical protein
VSRVFPFVAFFAVVQSTGLAAQTRARPDPVKLASIEGDAFLVVKSGDVKRLAGRQVYLAADPANFEVVRLTLCDILKERWRNVDASPQYGELAKIIVKTEQATTFVSSVDSAYVKHSQSSVSSGVNAHFAFRDVHPGEYVIWTVGELLDERYFLKRDVRLMPGSNSKIDLDNSAVFPGYCGAEKLVAAYKRQTKR